jgi:hypothetical protein
VSAELPAAEGLHWGDGVNVFASRRFGAEKRDLRGRIGVAAMMRGAARALVFVASLSMLAGCSTGGKAGEISEGGEVVSDPCEPECCCRAKDNYYVRYNCSSLIQCIQDGGVCTIDNLDKCLSEDAPTSETEIIEGEVPSALISTPRIPSLFG